MEGGDRLGNSKSRQTFAKKNAIKLVGYTLRLKNYVKIPSPTSFEFFSAGAATWVNLTVSTGYVVR